MQWITSSFYTHFLNTDFTIFLLNNHFEGRKRESEKYLHIYSKYLQVPYSLSTQNQIGTGHTLIWTLYGYFHSYRKDVLNYLSFYLLHEEIVDINFTFDKQLMAILTDWFSGAPSLLRFKGDTRIYLKIVLYCWGQLTSGSRVAPLRNMSYG